MTSFSKVERKLEGFKEHACFFKDKVSEQTDPLLEKDASSTGYPKPVVVFNRN